MAASLACPSAFGVPVEKLMLQGFYQLNHPGITRRDSERKPAEDSDRIN